MSSNLKEDILNTVNYSKKITAEEIIKTFNSLPKEEQDKILKECGLERS